MNNGADAFVNVKMPTTSTGSIYGQTSSWHRVYCNIRGNFYQIEYALSNEQMNGNPQESDVQIHAQILWSRAAGRIGAY
jgi:hypothetical protein